MSRELDKPEASTEKFKPVSKKKRQLNSEKQIYPWCIA